MDRDCVLVLLGESLAVDARTQILQCAGPVDVNKFGRANISEAIDKPARVLTCEQIQIRYVFLHNVNN